MSEERDPPRRPGPGRGGGRVVPPDVAAEVEDELQFHIEMRVRQLVREGWSEDEARAEAVGRFGDLEAVRSRMKRQGRERDVKRRRRRWWDEVAQDVRFATRQLLRARIFAGVAIFTLALGIGATSAVFSIVDGVLLEPLPYPNEDRVAVMLTRYLPASGFDIERATLSAPEAFDLMDGLESIDAMGVYSFASRALNDDAGAAQQIRVARVSAAVFEVLGEPAAEGRTFREDEDVPGGPGVIVLSHGLWTTRFGADPGVVGRTVRVDGIATEVVGVMPVDFGDPIAAEAWVPLRLDRATETSRGAHWLRGLALLSPGRTQEDLDAELSAVRPQWEMDYEHNVAHFAISEPLHDYVTLGAPRVLGVLMSAVGLVLLIACANVANLLLARGERRGTEFGVRASLGASRGRLVRQLMTESVVVALIASVVGLGIAAIALRTLVHAEVDLLPRLAAAELDTSVVLFTIGLSVVTAVAFGTVPALLAGARTRRSIASSDARNVGSRRRSALRRGLVAVEVALSVVVVILAGLTTRSLVAMTRTDPGIEATGALTFRVGLPGDRYPGDENVATHLAELRTRLEALPGVEGVTVANTLPFSGSVMSWDFAIRDRPPVEGEPMTNARVNVIGADYFPVLGTHLVQGRGITASDRVDGEFVSVISASMAEQWWPGEDPIGKQWGYPDEEAGATRWMTVVGVAADQYVSAVHEEPMLQVYIPLEQSRATTHGYVPRQVNFVLRARGEPSEMLSAARGAVAEFDPEMPIYSARTLDQLVDASVAEPRVMAATLGTFGLVALLLAGIGVYGVIAYSVAGRTREIGLRLALGARKEDVVRMILFEGTRPVAAGLVVGLGLAWLTVQSLEGVLYRVPPTDPLTFVTVPAVLLGIGLLASLVPALRGTSADPSRALTSE